MTDLLAKLDSYYRQQGIHPLDFRCRSRADCAKGCPNFAEAPASLVGTDYGKPIRLVVLSLDPGSLDEWPNPKDRTLEAVRGRQSADRVAKLHKGRHWYRTHETVAALLSCFGDLLETPEAAHRFAHVNAAKCSHNLPARKQAPAHLFDNCRPYLKSELALLAPDIVITQGDKAAAVVEPWRIPRERKPIAQVDGQPFYWLRLVHPTAWGGAYVGERASWPRLFRRARKWVESGRC